MNEMKELYDEKSQGYCVLGFFVKIEGAAVLPDDLSNFYFCQTLQQFVN